MAFECEPKSKKKRKSIVAELESSFIDTSNKLKGELKSKKKKRKSEVSFSESESGKDLLQADEFEARESLISDHTPFSGDLPYLEDSMQHSVSENIPEESPDVKVKKHKLNGKSGSKTDEEEKGNNQLGKNATISIALPGSILQNVHTLQLKTVLASQIARTCAIFKVSEIVLFDDYDVGDGRKQSTMKSCSLLKKMLEYSNCPQYLRKFLFVIDDDLAFASLLHPLATPSHMKATDFSVYREGLTLNRSSYDNFTYANCGIKNDVTLDRKLKPNLCVTVKFDASNKSSNKGTVVSPMAPHNDGLYWGYKVRMVNSLTELSISPDFGKYDLVVGTSDKGESIAETHLPKFNHMLVVFGGVNGLETAAANDDSLQTVNCRELFHHYLNCCPTQGSRTIRTEEALSIVLTSLKMKYFVL